MSFKDVLLSVLVPPTCFLYLAILGVAVSGRFPRRGRIIAGWALGGLLVLSLPAVSGAMIAGLEGGLPRTPPADAAPAAIVILGGDIQRSAEPPFALPGDLTFERLRAGAELWRRLKLPVLVTGGEIHEDMPSLGRVMADSLRGDFQVPVTWIEDKSATTWENATLSAAILKQQGITSVYIVTNAWHMRRAVIAFRRAGLTVTAEPASIDVTDMTRATGFIPSVQAWGGAYFAFHEWIGCAWYDLR